ncbi:amylo-alpha-1,6-glucosidase [Desulfopila sp. IMCC35006]|uniref:amylo-alpha-1,6-glucosidase n=1 Tax=Desulfopila sp. IMCC35006 TaxID=2569542 RepID=UPI00142EDFB6|nr:amylo-alpha-1,6-glucosidase [Desulfopila sp. IMCC35006]
MSIHLDRTVTQNFDEAIGREWLDTNGIGGWAGATISNGHTRRYHGLLVAATHPPVGRMVLLSKLEETLVRDGARLELGTNVYPGAVHPQGYRYLAAYTQDFSPLFTYEAGAIVLQKRVVAIHGENTTVIQYKVIEAPADFQLELRPFVAGREYHSLTQANADINRESQLSGDVWSYQPYAQVPALYMLVPGARFVAQADWYYNFEYLREKERGLDFHEDLFTPGIFTISLQAGAQLTLIVSTENPNGRNADNLLAGERARRKNLLTALPIADDLTRALSLAADQFVVRRGADLKTIIAGYHWFTDWGRDTMIALPGLTLVTRRYDDAKKILRVFAENIDQGMLPNRFPEAGEQPEYNTVDATLWFFVAAYKYFRYSQDKVFLKETLLPAMADILDWHQRGTRYGIHMESDGLLAAGNPDIQLTWMDAKIGDWVVTPRNGKAVEINALWYNALAIYARLLQTVGRNKKAQIYQALAEKVVQRFAQVFWNPQGGYLFDVVDGEKSDGAIRPNQILALSLPFPLLGRNRARQVLKTIEDHLLTPVGLRSLSPQDPDYHPTYEGSPFLRDSAYHQGTVWAWLLGPYLTALVRVRGKTGQKQGLKLLQAVRNHLAEAGIGQISEIFDGDAPHTPRGCIAQAWSVAEIGRAYLEDLLHEGPSETITPLTKSRHC